MSDQKLPIDPNSEDASNETFTSVSNDEETRLDAPLPPSAHGPNQSDDLGHVPGDDEPGEGPL